MIPNNYRMFYLMPPIAPVKNEQSRLMIPPALIPFCEVSIEQAFRMITCNENLKTPTARVWNATDIRAAKASLLPYVTSCGTFTRRSRKDFISPPHLVTADVDGLHSYREAVEIRCMLYDNLLLQPVLTFINPSGLGVGVPTPRHYSSTTDDTKNITENVGWAMRYIETAHGTVTVTPSETKPKVDFFGKDLIRSCFLSYGPEALFRTK